MDNAARRPEFVQAGLRACRRIGPLEWGSLVLGLVLVLRYAWIMDDAFIYFRYVDNCLFLHYGLVYNCGEYVEGFSSPLWALMLLVLRATQANYWLLVRAVGVAALLCFWWLLVLLNRRMSPEDSRPVNVPLMLLSANYAVASYFTSGLETPLVQVYAVVYALFVLSPGSRLLAVLLAVSPLVRHEFAVPLAVCLAWSWIRLRRFPTILVAASALVNGAWLLFRIYYYADLFQNTFYLKNVLDVRQGITYVVDTFIPYHMPEAIVLCAIGLLVLKRTGKTSAQLLLSERLVMLLVALTVLLYVVRIGGDPRHYRFLAYPFCLIACAFSGIAEHFVVRIPARRRSAAASVAGVLVLALSLSFHPRQLPDYAPFTPGIYRQFANINDAEWHRGKSWEAGFTSPWGLAEDSNLAFYTTEKTADVSQPYVGVRTGSWCVDLYYAPQDRIVQDLGLTEPVLARTEMRPDRAGHKYGLCPLGADIAAILVKYGNRPHRGLYRQAVEDGVAPQWIVKNLDAIEIIERKTCNAHRLGENLGLSLAVFPKIVP